MVLWIKAHPFVLFQNSTFYQTLENLAYGWSGPTGYVQSLLDHVLPDLKSPVALVCGSREMIAQTRDRLQQMGFAPQAILTNY